MAGAEKPGLLRAEVEAEWEDESPADRTPPVGGLGPSAAAPAPAPAPVPAPARGISGGGGRVNGGNAARAGLRAPSESAAWEVSNLMTLRLICPVSRERVQHKSRLSHKSCFG